MKLESLHLWMVFCNFLLLNRVTLYFKMLIFRMYKTILSYSKVKLNLTYSVKHANVINNLLYNNLCLYIDCY